MRALTLVSVMRIDYSCVCVIACVQLAGATSSTADEGDELLAALRMEDQVVKRLYTESTRVVPTYWTESYPRREHMRFTRGDRLYAIELELDEVLVDGSAPQVGGGRGISGRPAVPLWQYYLFDSGKSASRQVVALEQDASGVPVRTGPTQVIQHIYSADDISETMFIYMPKWLLGRGFSEHLTDLKQERTDDDGLLHASGRGFFSPSTLGRWRLTLDPTHAMLVREAEFLRDGDSQPMLRVQTAGLLNPESPAESAVEFAAVGHYIQIRGNTESSVDVENHRVLLEMDEAFFTTISDKFDEGLPVHSLVGDSRSKETVYRVTQPEKTEKPAAASPSRNPWPWRIVLINLGLLGAVLFYWFLYKLRKRGADN